WPTTSSATAPASKPSSSPSLTRSTRQRLSSRRMPDQSGPYIQGAVRFLVGRPRVIHRDASTSRLSMASVSPGREGGRQPERHFRDDSAHRLRLVPQGEQAQQARASPLSTGDHDE